VQRRKCGGDGASLFFYTLQEEKRMDDLDADLVAETENYMVWTSEVEGEVMFHLELGGISLHLTDEEWDELITLMRIVLP
jgi:hypothetical protein